MFPTRMFCNRFFAPRYFPKVGAVYVPPTDTGADASMRQAALARDNFPRYGAAIPRSSFGFTIPTLPVWRPAWR